MKKYDVAAYIWPSYTGRELRTRIFWEQGIGEWQSVKSAESRIEGQILPRRPLWGYCDEADPEVMKMQIDEAVSHGVNVFIYDWYWYDRRPFLEQCLDDGFLGAPNNTDMQFYLMWANHDAGYLWDKRQTDLNEIIWYGSQHRDEFEIICASVIEKYFKRPNYYKINGCPVFMIYELGNLVRGLGGIDETVDALKFFRTKVKEAGFPDLHLQGVIYSERAVSLENLDPKYSGTTKDLVKLLGLDSVTHYQYCHIIDCSKSYTEHLDDIAKEYERIHTEYDIPYYPHASIGWDNNPRYTVFNGPVLMGNEPENVKKGFELAKEYSDKYNEIPLVTINSWNEWTEMSYLEPDDVYGYGYLDAVRDTFGAGE